ncbi:uncharacterized protein VTP21DRAFT_203 [Calcarisporiella thermophila]|uniref:uncharacterized protein n=1 Tax=Calcarisporiella thermophila TaxID=911321 RepID=UPI003743AE38
MMLFEKSFFSYFILFTFLLPVTAFPSHDSQWKNSPGREHAQLKGRYIVRLKQGTSVASIQEDLFSLDASLKAAEAQNCTHESGVVQTITIDDFHAVVLQSCHSNARDILESRPDVEWVEPDQPIWSAFCPGHEVEHENEAGSSQQRKGGVCGKDDGNRRPNVVTQQNPRSYGLIRISQRRRDYSQPYRYPATAGEGVDVYVLDTGVFVGHRDLSGRAYYGANFVSESSDDLAGHGTHIACIIAGTQFGVAKKAHIYSVKILNRFGAGAISGLIAGVNWVANHHWRSRKSVVNLSLIGPKSKAIEDALGSLVKRGVNIVVAAGNEMADACEASPSGEPAVLTVGATNKFDQLAEFSSSGRCVDVYAPGVNILSCGVESPSATSLKNGTSFSAPFVSGIAALYLSQRDFSRPGELYKTIKNSATQNAIDLTVAEEGSNNLLAYNWLK